MAPIKVLHVIGGGEFGGAERHILNLTRALDPQAVKVIVCCLFREPFAVIAREAGIQVRVVPMRHKADFGVVRKIARLIRECEADLVHTHGDGLPGVVQQPRQQPGGKGQPGPDGPFCRGLPGTKGKINSRRGAGRGYNCNL